MAGAAGEIHDFVIVGAGPAGSAAALRAQALGCSTALIEREKFPRPRPCGGWLGPAGVALCGELGLKSKSLKPVEFTGVRIFSLDMKKNAAVKDKELNGWIVERAGLDQALFDAAKAAGAQVFAQATLSGITLGEDRVSLRFENGQSVAGRVLLAADGALSAAARFANLAPAGRQPEVARSISSEGPAMKGQSGLDIVIGAARILQVAAVTRTGERTRVTLNTKMGSDAAMDAFRSFISAAQAAGHLPKDMSAPQTMVAPLGTALDMEAHVGKRTLLIGDAGGFMAAFSGEGIYPAMRSGIIAAEVASRAIKSRWVQDELATFGDAWRTGLADYLRMPNTDLALLMPLVFNNPQMSARVARAFLLGQQF